MPSDHRPQMLEVEDVGQRQKRLRTYGVLPVAPLHLGLQKILSKG